MRAAILWGAAASLAVLLCRPAAGGQTQAAKVSHSRNSAGLIFPIVPPLERSSLNLPLDMTAGGAARLLSVSAPTVTQGMSAQAAAAKNAASAALAAQAPAEAALQDVKGSLSVVAAVKTAAGGGHLRAGISAEAVTPSPAVLGSASAGRDWAANSFELLAGGGAPRRQGASDAIEAPAPAGWTALKPSSLGRERRIRNSPPKAAGLSRAAPSFWEKPAGRALGSVLSYLLPLPDLVSSFRRVYSRSHTANKSPVKDSILAGVSLVLGLINALLSKVLWGISGIFGGLIILPILLIRTGSARRPAGSVKTGQSSPSSNWALGWNAPVKDAVIMAILVLALSAGLYFGAAAALPALLGHWLAPAAVTKLIFWIRTASIAIHAGFYLPALVSALRRWRLRRAAKLSRPR